MNSMYSDTPRRAVSSRWFGPATFTTVVVALFFNVIPITVYTTFAIYFVFLYCLELVVAGILILIRGTCRHVGAGIALSVAVVAILTALLLMGTALVE
ncbi:hypothetical protein [Nocardia vermiculata]|uniref:Uncharacterized protein n=1 Tax=Nocardia vermiculata TaxID=257274 RepID=A0A846Y9R3_9NOCA|nr:hypothetical protein [Nocardia vermiculata]NKY54534.1 hypothetical protein [Nocardia vermiculata]